MNNKIEPLVSIDCLTFNHEKFIRNTLEGFLMQKTDFNFEVLIHDDASTDQTAKIIKEYEQQYPDLIKPIYQTENQYSKNISIWRTYQRPRVQGKYIAICEGDDYWIDPLKLQKQIDIMESKPNFSMCCHDAIMLWENKQKQPRLFSPDILPTVLGMEDILNDWIIPTASFLFRSEILNNLPDWEGRIINGDFLLQLFCAHYGKIYYIDEPMCVYRKDISGNAVTSTELYENKFRFEQFYKLLDLFNKETNYIYDDLIVQTKKNKQRNYKYSRSKRKYGLLHYFLKPANSIRKLRELVKKNN